MGVKPVSMTIDEAAVEAGTADYGRIHFAIPKSREEPATIDELAESLKTHNARGDRVTIRNTGHSTNGQTLTSDVQISLGRLNRVRFDRDRKVAVAGAGTSWSDVVEAVNFPQFCPPIFPNNPGQLIHVGGTAAVGGVGFYCSTYGGFWNHVSGMRLVTMAGDIIDCSATENPELFRYSLGGYGRIGVMGEVQVDVVESKPKVFGIVLAYFDEDDFEHDLLKAMADPVFDGVAAQKDLSGAEAKILDLLGLDLRLIVGLVETDGTEDVDAVVGRIKDDYDESLRIYVEAGEGKTGLDLALTPKVFDKRDIVYFTPTEQSWWRGLFSKIVSFVTGKGFSSTIDPTSLCHPWTDCVVHPDRYDDFHDEATKIIKKHGLAKSLEKESFLSGLVDIDSFVTFGIRRMWKEPADRLPLSLDLADADDFSLGVAIMPNVERDKLAVGQRASKELSDLVYSLGGIRYLYGTHDLSPAQVEQHYGRATLDTWQRLKDELDPNHLLNIDVIEHLDS